MSMTPISEDEVLKLKKKYGFKFGKVKGTEMVQIIKKMSERFDEISNDDFFKFLKTKKLAVFKGQGDFLKIMKKK